VDVVKVVSRSAERKVQLPGEFIPFQTVTIHAKVTGFVDRVEVDRGSMVRKGQLLATLDAPELRAQRAEAEAKVLNAESQRAEAEAKVAAAQSIREAQSRIGYTWRNPGNELNSGGKDVDAARAKYAQSRVPARLAQASVQVVAGYGKLSASTAPFDGASPSEWLTPGALVGPEADGGIVPTGSNHAVTPGWWRSRKPMWAESFKRIPKFFHGARLPGTGHLQEWCREAAHPLPQDPCEWQLR